MTRYFRLLETRNRFANDDLWRGHARGAGACVCGHGGGRSSERGGGGMTRLLLVAAAGVVSDAGAEWHAHLGGGHSDSGCG